MSRSHYDAVIVGAGPNGLAAAITLAQQGLATLLVEAHETAGGGTRSADLTLPGYLHDVCSAVHPLALASPFFKALPLERFGLRFLPSPVPLVHVLSNGDPVLLHRSVEQTADGLGPDRAAYLELMKPLVASFDAVLGSVLGPIRVPGTLAPLARFGARAVRSMTGLARARFRTAAPGAMLGGIAAHSMVGLDEIASASFGLVLGMAAHAVGWPIAEGGSGAIARALVRSYQSLGGEMELGRRVDAIEELPRADAYLLDVSPRELLRVASRRLTPGYRRRIARFRYGPGVFKIDWALDGPIPWSDPRCGRAITVHLSGSLDEIMTAERALAVGAVAPFPFVILTQPTIVDASRAPAGRHVAWAYCHVPSGSRIDAAPLIEAHVERFAPGFRRRIVARATKDAVQTERHDPNYVGGDINGGLADIGQLFFRPVLSFDPYKTSAPDVFLCSSSTPPGGGVHGMCGYFAAQSALRHVFRRLGRAA